MDGKVEEEISSVWFFVNFRLLPTIIILPPPSTPCLKGDCIMSTGLSS